MNSRERLLRAIDRGKPDHVPLWCPSFGFEAPAHLRWRRDGVERRFWYSMRLEHDHTIPQGWDHEDDFHRVQRWFGLGVDDILEFAPPWSLHPDVTVRDWREDPAGDERYPLLCRAYDTPAGTLEHVVRQTDEALAPGWVVPPDHVALFEDFNVGRAKRHGVLGSDDLPKLRYLLQEPTAAQRATYAERVGRVRAFAQREGVLTQGWSAFGFDGIVDLCGVEGAVMLAMTEPDVFGELVETMSAFDRRRTTHMLEVGGADVVVAYGWYASVNFWSPKLLRRYLLPWLQGLAALAHQAGARFAYVMTQGALPLADLLLEAGIDVLYFVDDVQDTADLSQVRERFAGRMAVAGGVNAGVTLARGSAAEVRQATIRAVKTLGPAGGYILAPVDALFPDTPWTSVEAMIGAWKEAQGL